MALAKVVPFPIEANSGPCRLSLELLGAQMFRAYGEGFQPGEEAEVTDQSESEITRMKMKIRPDGRRQAQEVRPSNGR